MQKIHTTCENTEYIAKYLKEIFFSRKFLFPGTIKKFHYSDGIFSFFLSFFVSIVKLTNSFVYYKRGTVVEKHWELGLE